MSFKQGSTPTPIHREAWDGKRGASERDFAGTHASLGMRLCHFPSRALDQPKEGLGCTGNKDGAV